jgi:hypothetical protein
MAEGNGGLGGKFSKEQMAVGAADAAGLYTHEQFANSRLGTFYIAKDQLARRFEPHCLHHLSLLHSWLKGGPTASASSSGKLRRKETHQLFCARSDGR